MLGFQDHLIITNLPWLRRHDVIKWCRENLGEEASMPDHLGNTNGAWMILMLRPLGVDPLSMGPDDYRVAVLTKTPEDHALVRLTWC